jgi:hypothetical protein
MRTSTNTCRKEKQKCCIDTDITRTYRFLKSPLPLILLIFFLPVLFHERNDRYFGYPIQRVSFSRRNFHILQNHEIRIFFWMHRAASTTKTICPAPGKELDWTAPCSPFSLFIYLLLLLWIILLMMLMMLMMLLLVMKVQCRIRCSSVRFQIRLL